MYGMRSVLLLIWQMKHVTRKTKNNLTFMVNGHPMKGITEQLGIKNVERIANESSDFRVRVMGMVYNATFNNMSVISWQRVLLVEEANKHK